MMNKLAALLLVLSLLAPVAVLAQQKASPTGPVKAAASPAASSAPQTSSQSQTPPTVLRPQSQVRRRSYQRETKWRGPGGISKQEFIFLTAIAGTSMGIGALAGGGKGLAIGAIVGGWGAFLGHKIWKWAK